MLRGIYQQSLYVRICSLIAVREEITKFGVKNRDKITTHPNELTFTVLEEEEPRRLKILKSTELTTGFS
jgi:hypothetical protein